MSRVGRLVLAIMLCGAIQAGATSFAPVTFNDLVSRADVIFVGEVVDVRPFAQATRDGTVIKTRVVFRVSDPLFGTASTVEVFDFLGGELNGIGMAIAEMPTFAIGDRRVVFARRERSINPVVGFTQGLLQISRDAAGIDRVLTLEGVPVASPDDIGSRATAGAMRQVAMRLGDFRDRIRTAIAEGRRR